LPWVWDRNLKKLNHFRPEERKMKLWRKLLWLGVLAGSTASLLLILPASQAETKSAGTVTIVATTANNGELSPCG
jgi:hypothetical protein